MDAATTITVTYGLFALALVWVLGKGWYHYHTARQALLALEAPRGTADGTPT